MADEIEQRITRLKDELKKLEASRREANRKLQTRKKFVIGEAIQKAVKQKIITEDEFMALMDQCVKRKSDRELLGLVTEAPSPSVDKTPPPAPIPQAPDPVQEAPPVPPPQTVPDQPTDDLSDIFGENE